MADRGEDAAFVAEELIDVAPRVLMALIASSSGSARVGPVVRQAAFADSQSIVTSPTRVTFRRIHKV